MSKKCLLVLKYTRVSTVTPDVENKFRTLPTKYVGSWMSHYLPEQLNILSVPRTILSLIAAVRSEIKERTNKSQL